jgi:hypothetical protein
MASSRGKFAPADWQVGGGQFLHPGFDLTQVVGCKGALEGEVVKEAVFDHRADGDLSAGIELLDGHGQQVGAGVAEDFQPFRVTGGDQADGGILFQNEGGIDELGTTSAIDPASHCGLGQTGADVGSQFGDADGLWIGTLAAVGQRDDRHVFRLYLFVG